MKESTAFPGTTLISHFSNGKPLQQVLPSGAADRKASNFLAYVQKIKSQWNTLEQL